MKPTYLKEIHVEQAVGMKLGHDLTRILPGEFKGRAFKAGHVITEEDIPKLLDIGKRHIYVLDIPEGFLHENEGAERMAKALSGENIQLTEPVEGKVTLKSTIHGLLKVNAGIVHQANEIEEISVSTLVDNVIVRPGQSVAGVRPIPLIIDEAKIQSIEGLAAIGPALRIKPFQSMKVGMVTTGSEVFTGRIQDKFGPVVREKIQAFGSEVVEQRFADDDTEHIQQEIRYFLEQKVDLILVTGGMSVDPDDRTPGAIKGVGAHVVRYGTPMLPGSMLMVAYYGDTPILGLPGCVMHDPYTSFDVFLPRILAGEKIVEQDIISLGYGGYHSC